MNKVPLPSLLGRHKYWKQPSRRYVNVNGFLLVKCELKIPLAYRSSADFEKRLAERDWRGARVALDPAVETGSV